MAQRNKEIIMAFFNSIPKMPSLKFDPSKYNLRPEAPGFKMPSLDIKDYQVPSLPSAKPEPWGGRTNFSDEYGTTPPTTPDFGGIEPYRMPTETRGTASTRTSAYPTQTRTSAYPTRTSGSSSTQIGRAAPIPYGSQTSWQPYQETRDTGRGAYPVGDPMPMPTMGAYPEYLMPEMGALPQYEMPEMDRARIGELTELGMGAPMGRLKEGLSRALLEARYSTNPMVRAMARKQAMSGYGGGISDIRTGAHRGAMAEYMPEFQAQVGKSQVEYQAGIGKMQSEFQARLGKSQSEWQARVQKIRDQFQSDMQDYIRKGKQVTTPVEGRRGTASTDPRYQIEWRV